MGLCDVLPQGGCVPSVEPLYLFSPPSPPLRPPLPTTSEPRLQARRRRRRQAVRSINTYKPDGTRRLTGPAELGPSSQLGIGHLDARVMLVRPRRRKRVHSPELEGNEPDDDVTPVCSDASLLLKGSTGAPNCAMRLASRSTFIHLPAMAVSATGTATMGEGTNDKGETECLYVRSVLGCVSHITNERTNEPTLGRAAPPV